MSVRFSRFSTATLLAVALIAASSPVSLRAQTGAAQTVVSSGSAVSNQYAAKLAEFETKFEKRRAELGIPGASVAIVKDNEVIYLKGLGYKDFERKVPVTPDTEFAIGSSTKAFTALSVLMSQDRGKLSLDDAPKKHLPYFRINDPEIDARITVRDLLSHSSGLNRTDLAMISGKLNREELIRVAGEAKPTAKLREKFQYQNIMFTAAGEIVARVQGKPWERFVTEDIFKPLGMTNSNLTVKEMQAARDYSFGYDYNFDTKQTRKLPTRDIVEVAPAGSINSSARDMTNWLKFLINGGAVNGKRLISEASFAEFIKPQMKIGGTTAYGLGWFVRDFNGTRLIEHGGNIDGFNAQVGFLPDKRMGIVILTNVTASPLTQEMMRSAFETLLDAPKPASQTANDQLVTESETGKYRFEAAGFDVDVTLKDGKLLMTVPGQPVYTLENVSGKRYRLAGAPTGFFVTFRPGKTGDTEVYLEQPHGNYALPRVKANGAAAGTTATATITPALRELVGKYEFEASKDGSPIEVVEREGKIFLLAPGGQPPYELRETAERDTFNSPALPDAYKLKARRDTGGKFTGIMMIQPEGEFNFKRAVEANNAAGTTALPSIDEVVNKTIDALGGGAIIKNPKTRVTKFEIDFVHQGVKGTGTTYEKAPNLNATETVMTALGKKIGEGYEYFDGVNGGEDTSFTEPDAASGERLEDVRRESDFYGLANYKTLYKTATVTRTAKVGDEETFVVELQPEKGNKVTVYISGKTFLPLKRESVIASSTSQQKIPYSEIYSDYRKIDGQMIPFKSVSNTPSQGEVIQIVLEVRHDVAVPDTLFRAKTIK